MALTVKRITTVSPKGIRWIAMLEGGYKLKAYQDTNDTWTISAGVTFYSRGIRVRKGDVLESGEVAEKLFRERLAEFEGYVDSYTRDDITQLEFDALVDACFNIGHEAFRTSTFRRRFNQKASMDSVCEALSWFRNETIDGKLKLSPGLVKRRACEIYLLKNGLYRLQGGTELR